MTCAIQNYLRKNNIEWKLVHGDEFRDFQRVLDNVMKESAAMSLGMVKKASWSD